MVCGQCPPYISALFPSYSLNNHPSIWQGGITKGQTIQQSSIEVDRSRKIDISEISRPTSIRQVGTVEVTANKLGSTQTSFGQLAEGAKTLQFTYVQGTGFATKTTISS